MTPQRWRALRWFADQAVDARHVARSTADEEADVQWCDSPTQALALSGELEFIRAPRITSEIAYAVAMHELGHIKSHSQASDQIERERAAWDWARRNALKWTPHMEGYAVASLRGTRRSAKRPLSKPDRRKGELT
jgi:hypothetical protein